MVLRFWLFVIPILTDFLQICSTFLKFFCRLYLEVTPTFIIEPKFFSKLRNIFRFSLCTVYGQEEKYFNREETKLNETRQSAEKRFSEAASENKKETRKTYCLQAQPYGETHDFRGNQYTEVKSPRNE